MATRNKYPFTGISKQGRVVRFTKPKEGTVIVDPNGYHEKGLYITCWDMNCFTIVVTKNIIGGNIL